MKRLAAYASVIAVIIGFAQAAHASPDHPRVVVTLAPIQAYVDVILKSVAVSSNLLTPAQDPHSSGLSPDQATALDRADILIIPDRDMNPELARVLASKKNLRVIELSLLPGAEPLPYVTDNPWVDAHTEKPKEKAPEAPSLLASSFKIPERGSAEPNRDTQIDPHLWLDPERMAAMTSPLAEAIAAFSPGHRAVLMHNAMTLENHLRRDVTPGVKALLTTPSRSIHVSSKPRLAAITTHAAFQYFQARFGLARDGHLTDRPQDYLGAATTANILAAAQKVHITCVIGESENALVRRVEELSGARFVFLSAEERVEPQSVPPLGWIQTDYDRLLYKVGRSFGGCL